MKSNNSDFNAQEIAQKLLQLFGIKDKKEEAIIEMVVNTRNDQRKLIKDEYYKLYSKDLVLDLEQNLNGDFKNAILALFYNPIDYDCIQLRKAVKGAGTNEDTLIEIISSRMSDTIEKIKKRYEEIFPGRNLIKDVENDTSGNFRKLLLELLKTKRSRKTKPDLKECEDCAKELFNALEQKLVNKEDVFIDIFTKKSFKEFIVVSQYYYKLASVTLLQAVEKNFFGDFKKCLSAIMYSVMNPSEFFALKINQSVHGPGTDENLLTRVIVTRREKDLAYIKQYYYQIFRTKMEKDIIDDTSGYFRDLLVKLVSG